MAEFPAYAEAAMQADRRKGQVPSELEDLAKAVDILVNRTQQLTVRLGPVLREDEPSLARMPQDRPYMVPLAAGINDQAAHLYEISARLENLLERIEL